MPDRRSNPHDGSARSRRARSSCASTSARTCRRPMSARRSTTGDMGFLHSFTTGSAVDGPGVRVVAWTAGCMWRCLYCHNPDTWTMRNGIPVTVEQAVEELRKYRHGLQGHERRPHDQRRRAADAGPLRGQAVRRRAGDGHPHGARHQRLLRRPPHRRASSRTSTSCCSTSRPGIRSGTSATRHGDRPDPRVRAPSGRAQAPDLGAVRARAGLDRRPRRHRADRRGSPPVSATSSASTCCRSTRWGGSSGRSWEWRTRSLPSSRRHPRPCSGRSTPSGPWDCAHTECSPSCWRRSC